jgi:hypothetical protein
LTSKNHKESFVRWQGITISQLGYVVNLILGFATASLAFSVSILRDQSFPLQGWGRCFFRVSFIALVLSILSGMVCIWNRLRDFRLTTRIARDREQSRRDKKSEEQIDSDLRTRRETVKTLGKLTWWLLYTQLVAFGLGLTFLVAVFLRVYHAWRF